MPAIPFEDWIKRITKNLHLRSVITYETFTILRFKLNVTNEGNGRKKILMEKKTKKSEKSKITKSMQKINQPNQEQKKRRIKHLLFCI